MSHAQIRNDMSNKRKERSEGYAAAHWNGSGKSGKTALVATVLTSQAAYTYSGE